MPRYYRERTGCITDWKRQGSTGASSIYKAHKSVINTILHSCTGCRKWLANMGNSVYRGRRQGRGELRQVKTFRAGLTENGSFKLKVPGKTTCVEILQIEDR